MNIELDARGWRYLDRFRKLAFALSDVVETESFGHPWFRVGGAKGKMLSVFGQEDGPCSVCFKATKEDQTSALGRISPLCCVH